MPRDDDLHAGIFHLGHTIVLSRGLIDVLPDEASLATMIAHELGHIVLGHRMDTSYAFFDQLLGVQDKDTFRHFGFARTPDEENAASAKGRGAAGQVALQQPDGQRQTFRRRRGHRGKRKFPT